MTSGSICRYGLPWQERWCVVMDGHLLHPELTVCRRCWSWWSWWVPVVENQVQSHHRCGLLGVHHKVHPSLIWRILTMLLLVQHITIITVITDSDRVI